MKLANMMLLAAEGSSNWITIVLLIVLVVFMLVIMPMMNRKKQKEVNEVYNTIAVGDEIMTIGGIMGKVVALSTHESGEKLMVIETGEGENKMTMTFTVQALRLNYTKNKLRQEQLAKEKAEREAAKNNKGKQNEELPLEEVAPEEPTQEASETSEEGENTDNK